MQKLNMNLISKAKTFLKDKILETPLEFSPDLSEIAKAPIFFKMEAQQITGSFKVRGAYFYLSTLDEKTKKKGVAACSAGNHGLGVAYAAKKLSIPCTVFVPKNVDSSKRKKIEALGAKIELSEFIGYDETLIWAEEEVKKRGLHLISAFEDERIMAANGGTLAFEILKSLPDVENVLFPVGGGGLAGGLSYYFHTKNPKIRLIGCQHEKSPGLKRSFEEGKAITFLPPIETIAGGLEGGLGIRCFEVLKKRMKEACLVSEEDLQKAFCWMLDKHQYLIEPSALAGLAASLFQKIEPLKGKTVILLTGRNISLESSKKLVSL